MQALLLWQWSTTVQITSALMLAVFMGVFRRSLKSPVMDLWAGAWAANLGALVITVAYWFGAHRWIPATLLTSLYITCKTLFLTLLVAGVRQQVGLALPSLRTLLLGVGTAAMVLGTVLHGIPRVGLTQASLIATAMGYGGWLCLRSNGLALGWLGCGLWLRAALALVEAGVYGAQVQNGGAALGDWLDLFLAAHSSFDTGAEWLIALGCVLAMAQQSQRRLEASHSELFAANRRLQQAAHHDPLTGLANRLGLHHRLEAARAGGARLLFFDLDGFKDINDRLGHDVGDLCLRRFADALRLHFGDAEHLVRYAGDEFLVIDRLRPDVELQQRIAVLRSHLGIVGIGMPAIEFSVGCRTLEGDEDIDLALRQTDTAMYEEKRARRQAART